MTDSRPVTLFRAMKDLPQGHLLAGGTAMGWVIARLFGGQGTINVPSWSPDSQRLAFVDQGSFLLSVGLAERLSASATGSGLADVKRRLAARTLVVPGGLALGELGARALIGAGGPSEPAEFQVYDTHLTVVPEHGDPQPARAQAPREDEAGLAGAGDGRGRPAMSYGAYTRAQNVTQNPRDVEFRLLGNVTAAAAVADSRWPSPK